MLALLLVTALAQDADGDGIPDDRDNCPNVADLDQSDDDGDGFGAPCDNCPDVPNDQDDYDQDGFGDDCDVCFNELEPTFTNTDTDQDGLGDPCDNCPFDPNPDQMDTDADGLGDVCDDLSLDLRGCSEPSGTACGTTPSGGTGLLWLAALGAVLRGRERWQSRYVKGPRAVALQRARSSRALED